MVWVCGGAQPQDKPAPARAPCGELVTVQTHASSRTPYTWVASRSGHPAAAALVLLVGGGGHLDLDPDGCPRALSGNSLVRMQTLFHAAGFATALVDAPSDFTDADGLSWFRMDPSHAQDLARVIADVRGRTAGPVWLVGTSRGSLSAANAAARLSGAAAADGLVLTSVLMLGDASARKSWLSHTVFDLPLEAIRMPVLIVGHQADACIRSPARLMRRVEDRLGAGRHQVVTVTGGATDKPAHADASACEGRMPHGFVGQEEEVADGIARFVRGGRY